MNPGDFFIKTSRGKTTLNHSAAISAIWDAISPEMIESTRRLSVGDGGTNYRVVAKPPLTLRFVANGGNKKLLAVLGSRIGDKHSKHQYGVLIFVEISQLIRDLWQSLMLNKYPFSVQTGFLKFTQKRISSKTRCWGKEDLGGMLIFAFSLLSLHSN